MGLLAFGAAVAAIVATRLGATGFLPPAAPSGGEFGRLLLRGAGAGAAQEAQLEAASTPSQRRRDALAAAAAAAVASASAAPALAEEVVGGPSSRLQRVVVNVGDQAALDAELKFWTEAALMKKLGDFVGADGLRSVVVGYGAESSGKDSRFALEIKVDPAVLNRRRPRSLNYEVMQPTVDAMCFMQIGISGKSMEIFGRVQNSGGASIFGDATYLDAESPRGVPMRFVIRPTAPAIELVSFNIEVPAFEPTVRFYKRTFGFKEDEYPETDPPIQKKSVLLTGDGGPDLLLSPVPDGRLKERALDEFENMLMVTNDPAVTNKAAEDAIAIATQEEKEYEEKFMARLRQLKKGSKEEEQLEKAIKAYRTGTRSRPGFQTMSGQNMINDGVGNFVSLSSPANFDTLLSTGKAA